MSRPSLSGRRAAAHSIAMSALSLAVGPLIAQPAAPRRIGALWFGTPPAAGTPNFESPLLLGLRELGHEPGRTLVVVDRFGLTPEQLVAAAEELMQQQVELIVVGGPAPLVAARAVTRSLPVVVVGGGDPVAEGWAKSLARPGGNVTGLTVTFPELMFKQLELLKRALPQANRVAVMHNPDELAGWEATMTELRETGRRLDVQVRPVPVVRIQDIAPALNAIRASQDLALMTWATNLIVSQRSAIAERALALKLPTFGDFGVLARSGFMLSYGANLQDLLRRAAGYVDRILKGAQPAEMPIERPTRLQLVVNLKTASALGVSLPRALVVQADELVE